MKLYETNNQQTKKKNWRTDFFKINHSFIQSIGSSDVRRFVVARSTTEPVRRAPACIRMVCEDLNGIKTPKIYLILLFVHWIELKESLPCQTMLYLFVVFIKKKVYPNGIPSFSSPSSTILLY